MEGNKSSYQDLIVWQKAMDLVTSIYELTSKFPHEERFGIISQMRRAAVSIPSNIAEGKRRYSRLEFCRFLKIAFGSGAELETQLEISKRLKFVNDLDYKKSYDLLNEVMRLLNAIIYKLNSNEPH